MFWFGMVCSGGCCKVALGFVICIFMVCLNIYISPYMDPIEGRLALLCLIQLSTTLFMGLLVKVDTVKENSASSHIMAGLMVFLNGTLLMVPLAEYGMFALMSKYHQGAWLSMLFYGILQTSGVCIC